MGVFLCFFNHLKKRSIRIFGSCHTRNYCCKWDLLRLLTWAWWNSFFHLSRGDNNLKVIWPLISLVRCFFRDIDNSSPLTKKLVRVIILSLLYQTNVWILEVTQHKSWSPSLSMLFLASSSERIMTQLSKQGLYNLVILFGQYFFGSSRTLVTPSNTLASSFFSMKSLLFFCFF